jgi:gliding motility-associated-like protein
MSRAQVTVVDNLTATQLVEELVGQGVAYSNPVLNCPQFASGSFTAAGSNLGLDSGIVLTSGLANTGSGFGGTGVNGNSILFADNDNFAPGDLQLDSMLTSTPTYDACVLEFDFIPTGDSLSFNYVFGSEEYVNYSCDIYNDIFAFLISGPGFPSATNIALIPGTTIPVAINSTTNTTINFPNNISLCTGMGVGSPFSQYYVDNSMGATITYDGFTTVLAAKTQVIPCTTYHIKLAIADAADGILDSGVFLEKGSFKSNTSNISFASLLTGVPDLKEGCTGGTVTVQTSQTSSSPQTIYLQYGGSAANGSDYQNAPDSVVIPANDSVTTFNITAVYDSIPEGTENIIITMIGSCGQIDSLIIPVEDLFPLTLLSTDTIACAGSIGSIGLNATADPLYQFLWTADPNTTVIANPAAANTTASPSVTTVFTVTASYPGCPTFTDSFGVVLGNPIVDILTADTTICLGESFDIAVNVLPNITSNNYDWTPASFLTNANTLNPTYTASQDGTTQYVLTVTTSQGCFAADSITIRTAPAVIVNIQTPDTTVCEGSSISILADVQPAGTSYSYNWQPSTGIDNPGAEDPTYTAHQSDATLVLSATSAEGCTGRDSILVLVELNPLADILTADTAICFGDSIQLDATVSPIAPYIFSWSPAENLIGTAGTSPVYYAADPVDRRVIFTATSQRGCRGSDSVLISVKPYPVVDLIPNDTSICMDAPLQLVAHVQPEGNYTYFWTGPAGLSATDINNPSFFTETPGSYQFTVFVSSATGCTGTDTSIVHTRPLVTLINVTPGQTIRYGSDIQLNADGAIYYVWTPPATLDNPNIKSPVGSPREPVIYTVQGLNEWGCRDTAYVKVDLESMTEFVPSVFSPNADGLNDVFRVVNLGFQRLQEFRVFNRLGQEIFATTDINRGWDGSFKGEPQDPGVYHYLIRVGRPNGEAILYKGDVTLVR